MTTTTDTEFASRFAGLNVSSFVNNNATLPGFVPAQSPINLGMYDDIGRATLYGYDIQESFFDRFMKSPLTRGDAEMMARFSEVNSRAYNPNAPDTDLFNGSKPSMLADVAKKNLSRQIYTEINDHVLKQYVQTEDMINNAIAILQASNYNCYRDDMWVAAKTYFSGSVRSAPAGSNIVLTHRVDDAGFAEEFSETLYNLVNNKFAYKSSAYNASGYRTKAENVAVCLTKDLAWPAFQKYYSNVFNPEYLKVKMTTDYVDSWATPAGMPQTADRLIGIAVDPRAWSITPLPDALTTEAFRNPVRKSTSFATTYEYIFHTAPFFDIAFIWEPAEEENAETPGVQ